MLWSSTLVRQWPRHFDWKEPPNDRHPDASSDCTADRVHELREREDGQTTTEYAILLGFLAIAIIVALFFLRNVLRGLFSDAASSVSMAPGP